MVRLYPSLGCRASRRGMGVKPGQPVFGGALIGRLLAPRRSASRVALLVRSLSTFPCVGVELT